MTVGLVVHHAEAEPDDRVAAGVAAEKVLDLGARPRGIAIRVEEALLRREQRALAVGVNGAALEHQRCAVPRHVFVGTHRGRHRIVVVPRRVQPAMRPPHALNSQSTPRVSPRSLTTNVGPMSRIHASSLAISTTLTPGPTMARAPSTSPGFAASVTGSAAAISSATAAKARRAGPAPSRQLSGRPGHAIQHPALNSPGIRTRPPPGDPEPIEGTEWGPASGAGGAGLSSSGASRSRLTAHPERLEPDKPRCAGHRPADLQK